MAHVAWWISWSFAIDQYTRALPFRVVLAWRVHCFMFRSDWPAGFVCIPVSDISLLSSGLYHRLFVWRMV